MVRSRGSKGPYIASTKILKNVPRNMEISAQYIGSICKVYTGKKFVELSITSDMVGFKIGEFVPTRVRFSYIKKKKKKK